jgi:hypothetical protein
MGFCGAFHVAKFRTSLCKKITLPMKHPNPDYCVSNITEQPAAAGGTMEIVTCVSLNTNRLYVPTPVVASLATALVISVEGSLPPCKILLHNLFSTLSISTGLNWLPTQLTDSMCKQFWHAAWNWRICSLPNSPPSGYGSSFTLFSTNATDTVLVKGYGMWRWKTTFHLLVRQFSLSRPTKIHSGATIAIGVFSFPWLVDNT